MANFENIRPYSELVHQACKGGGPDKFLRDYAKANYNLGVQAEQATEGWKIGIAVATTLAIWEGCKAGYRCLKRAREERVLIEKVKAEIAANNIKHNLAVSEGGL